jgi:hypothetical protein
MDHCSAQVVGSQYIFVWKQHLNHHRQAPHHREHGRIGKYLPSETTGTFEAHRSKHPQSKTPASVISRWRCIHQTLHDGKDRRTNKYRKESRIGNRDRRPMCNVKQNLASPAFLRNSPIYMYAPNPPQVCRVSSYSRRSKNIWRVAETC